MSQRGFFSFFFVVVVVMEERERRLATTKKIGDKQKGKLGRVFFRIKRNATKNFGRERHGARHRRQISPARLKEW